MKDAPLSVKQPVYCCLATPKILMPLERKPMPVARGCARSVFNDKEIYTKFLKMFNNNVKL